MESVSNNLQSVAYCQCNRLLILLLQAEREIRFLQRKLHVHTAITLHRHGPRILPNICHLPTPIRSHFQFQLPQKSLQNQVRLPAGDSTKISLLSSFLQHSIIKIIIAILYVDIESCFREVVVLVVIFALIEKTHLLCPIILYALHMHVSFMEFVITVSLRKVF